MKLHNHYKHHLQTIATRWARTSRLFTAVSFMYAAGVLSSAGQMQKEPGLLFYLSGDRGLAADYAAGGNPVPNFANDQVKILPGGAKGSYLQCGDHEVLSYWAPGNIYAQRGTLSFYWRSRESVGKTEFPVFRVGYGDHSSWDMVWLRIDYNGKPGFDAFVTDVNLGRTRVSTKMPAFPKPSEWVHLALSWDEIRLDPRVRTVINLKLLAKGVPYWSRPDLGITAEDIRVEGNRVRVTIHSIGAADAPASRMVLRDREERVLATANVPALKAPADLLPKTAEVVLSLPANADWKGGSITVETAGGLPEITLKNNRVEF